jgi:hypothetical protein
VLEVKPAEGRTSISTQELNTGVYFLTVETGKGNVVKKLIKN